MKAVGAILCAGLLTSAAIAGPISTERKSQFEKAMMVIMASVTPQLSDLQRESLVGDYAEGKPNKGQAVDPIGGH